MMLNSAKKILVFSVLLAPLGVHAMEIESIELGEQLVEAAERKDWHWQKVEKLIAAGADVNQKNSIGWTALMYAARDNRPEVAHLLITAGADVNQKTNGGSTALMYAVQCNHPEIARLLLAAGADVNQKNDYGSTALIRAARHNHPEICRDIVRAYLAPATQQKERVYTLLNCFLRLYRGQYKNLIHVFKPWLYAMIREVSQPMYEDIDSIENTEIKEELLAICDKKRNKNNQSKE